MLKLDTENIDGVMFVSLSGELNRLSSYKINNYLVPLILKEKIAYLVYNMERLSDIDDAGIDALLNTKYAIKINRGKVAMYNLDRSLNRKLNKVHIRKIDDELRWLNKVEA